MDTELYEYLYVHGGATTIYGSDVCPTLVSSMCNAISGSTQDAVVVVCLVDDTQNE